MNILYDAEASAIYHMMVEEDVRTHHAVALYQHRLGQFGRTIRQKRATHTQLRHLSQGVG